MSILFLGIGAFIGFFLGLLVTSLICVSSEAEERERRYWEEKQKYEKWMEEEQKNDK